MNYYFWLGRDAPFNWNHAVYDAAFGSGPRLTVPADATRANWFDMEVFPAPHQYKRVSKS